MDSDNLIIKLNQRVEIVSLQEQTDVGGNIFVKKTNIASVWASIKPISTSEWLGFRRKDHSTYYSILLRFLPNVKMGHFVSFKNKLLEINSVIHDEELNTTQITAQDNGNQLK